MLDFLNIEHLDDGDVAVEVFGFGSSSKIETLRQNLISKIKSMDPGKLDDGDDFESDNRAKKLFAIMTAIYNKTKSSSEWSRYQSACEKKAGTKFQLYLQCVGPFYITIVIGFTKTKDGGSEFVGIYEEIIRTALNAFPNLRARAVISPTLGDKSSTITVMLRNRQ